MCFRLDKGWLYLKSCGTLQAILSNKHPPQRMWPVQTLTLLLCLTDEEQLFAHNQPRLEEIPAVEATAPVEAPAIDPETDFVMEPAA